MTFPTDFIWGAATASYQIEGAAQTDGRGECIWTRFSHTPGKVLNGDTGDVACDHYHRYPEDIALMKSLGLDSYRFSISWPRILPQGVGAVNAAGLDFYERLVDGLLEAGITPFGTLYHWDLPQALQEQGGWANPDSVRWFADYADTVTARLGDRVQHWITHNEPWVVAFLGNWFGEHAPGLHDLNTAYKVAHHLLLSHGAAVPIIRTRATGAEVGITLNLTPQYPASDSPEDQRAAQHQDGFINRWFLDAVCRGHYPDDMVQLLSGETEASSTNYLEGIDLSAVQSAAAPTDFVGLNLYTRGLIRHSDEAPAPFFGENVHNPDAEYTHMDWEVYPQGFTDMLVRMGAEYQIPAIYVTENGSAYVDDTPAEDASILEDPARVAYLEKHLAAMEQALAQGAPIKGYFVWSLLDNFEWAWGYSRRFGIIHIDYDSLKRTPKRSAYVYRDFIAAQR